MRLLSALGGRRTPARQDPHDRGDARHILFNVQLLRFLAAFAILFTHIADILFHGSPLVTAIPWTGGVDVFFVISGFIMAWMTAGDFGKPGAAARFLLRRIVRVVPPYWFFTIILIVAVVAAGGRLRNTTAEPMQVLTSLLFVPWPRIDGQLVPILAQGWTLNYEMFFYLAFALSMLFRRGLLILACTFTALVAVHPFVPDNWFALAFYTDPLILEFLLGIALGRLYLSGVRLNPIAAALMITLAIIAFLALPAIEGPFAHVIRVGGPAGLLTAAVILAPEPRRIGRILGAAKLGGDASYTLYLSHTLIIFPLVLLAELAAIDLPWLVLTISLFVAISFSVAFYRWAEAPFTKLLGRRLHAQASYGPATVAP